MKVSDLDDVFEPPTKLDYDPLDNSSLEARLTSLHSFLGHWTPRTFRVTGSINGYEVQIMVDSCATHNFIQTKITHFLNLALKPTSSPLRVMVGNEEFLHCTTFCPKAHLNLASLEFPTDLYPLNLFGTDVVLGIQWLTQVSPFIIDHNGPFMRFM
ncbi:hypothetical protein V8G54_019797 [Vigna mungo]|uniref:RVP_2 domain-containing protein n=1 Tax=Vigna mungo TaxID=3915 RepID=A0AAQ3RW39_VIGMU